MRTSQSDAHFALGKVPEEHRGFDTLCETIKRFGYSKNNQVLLHGEIFDLMSDPVAVAENLVFVDALDRKSGRVRRVRIPPTIVQRARLRRRAA